MQEHPEEGQYDYNPEALAASVYNYGPYTEAYPAFAYGYHHRNV
jgi:hypothetical protein